MAVALRAQLPENVGKLVEVIGPLDNDGRNGPEWYCRNIGAATRMVHQASGDIDVRAEGWIPDGWLRPLRDGNAPDETLTWAGKPETVSA